MSPILSIIRSRASIALAGVLFFCVTLWYLGPLISFAGHTPFQSAPARFIGIGVALLLWGLFTLYRLWKAKKQNANVLDALADQDASSLDDDLHSAESAELQRKMQEAVAVLKNKDFSNSGGARYLSELPWYLIIGPPGAGKTTLLNNSGLNFPLEKSHGKFSVKGVGGTRNCDWWFTDQAVLLDTAGRYTTQDSNSGVDKKAWDSFLQLVKDNRPRRPVNGLFIALALHDLVTSTDDQLTEKAKTIRIRIDEVQQKFGMTPPVYLIITKCDLLAGFTEFFSDLDQTQRQQVWGFTVSADAKTDFQETTLNELTQLRSTLYQQTTLKLQNESSQRHRDQIYSFPLQFANIQGKISLFTRCLSTASGLHENIYLRGLYLTSATQTGSPFDQVVASVSGSFGFASDAQSSVNTAGKSFFIQKLLTDVVFPEAGLAGTDTATEKRANWLQRASIATIALLAVGLCSVWGVAWQRSQSSLDNIIDRSDKLGISLADIPDTSLDLIQTSDMLTLAGELDNQSLSGDALVRSSGLYQGGKLTPRLDRKYHDLLIDGLLARLMTRLEHQMLAESNDSEFVFEAVKTYQMINNEEHYNAEDMVGWFQFDYARNLDANISADKKNKLIEHTRSLFKNRPHRLPRPLDKQLIDQMQQIAAATPLEQRAYSRIKHQHADKQNQYLSFTANASTDVSLALELNGDRTFNSAVPLFYTKAVYLQDFLPSSTAIVQTLDKDKWVLGRHAAAMNINAVDDVTESVIEQYLLDYKTTWQNLLESLKPRKSNDLAELVDFISLVTDADSPLKKLLVLVSEHTDLTIAEPNNKPDTESAADSRQQTLNTMISTQETQEKRNSRTPNLVTEHFKPLQTLLENWQNNTSRLDTVLKQLADLNLQLLPMVTTPGAISDPVLTGQLAVNLQKLSARISRLPASVSSVVKGITNEVNDITSGGFCAQLNSQWMAEVYPFYERALRGKYPVSRRASSEITPQDFGNFFATGGILDTFVSKYLNNQVQRTSGQWTWVGSGNSVCLSDNTLRQLALADDIRQSFFTTGQRLPNFSFSLKRSNMQVDHSIDRLHLNIAGETVEFFHGPLKGSGNFEWPGTSGNTEASLRVEPSIPGSESRINLNGPWAMLRLLDKGNLKQRSRSNTTVEYDFGGRRVKLEFQTSSFNALNSRALREFSAPKTL